MDLDIRYERLRKARFLFRDAIRADMGLTEEIFQKAEERFHKVRMELDKLEAELEKPSAPS